MVVSRGLKVNEMTAAPFGQRGQQQIADDVIVEPAAVVWERRLRAELPSSAPPATVAERTARLIGEELAAHHVALWTLDEPAHDPAYVVMGATGLSRGAMEIRLAVDFPLVNVCRGSGGRLIRDEGSHHGPRAPGLPGSSSPAYAMLMLDGTTPVHLVTMSAPRIAEDAVDAVRYLLEQLPWQPPTRV